jgi:hypothetical protein
VPSEANGLISKQRGSSDGSSAEALDHESPAAGLPVSMDTILRLGRIAEAAGSWYLQLLNCLTLTYRTKI